MSDTLKVHSHRAYGFTVLTVQENMRSNAGLVGLLDHVKEALEKGSKNIAVRLPQGSFLTSPNIAPIVRSIELVRFHGGKFAIIRPTPQVLAVLQITALFLDTLILDSEDELAAVPANQHSGQEPPTQPE